MKNIERRMDAAIESLNRTASGLYAFYLMNDNKFVAFRGPLTSSELNRVKSSREKDQMLKMYDVDEFEDYNFSYQDVQDFAKNWGNLPERHPVFRDLDPEDLEALVKTVQLGSVI